MKRRPDPRHARFVEEYAVDGVAAAAARRAGYPAATANSHGCLLLKRPEVAAAVAAKEAERLAAAELGAERVLREAARIAFTDIRDVLRPDGTVKDIAEFDADLAAAVASVTMMKTTGARRLRLRSKQPALALLGRHLQLWRRQAAGAGESVAEVLERVRQEIDREFADAGTNGDVDH